MAIRIEVGRRDLPIGLPTLQQVTAIRDQAQAAAGVAAAGMAAIGESAPGQGAALVGYAPGLSGSVPRDVQGKLDDWFTVTDFGAVGDGVTDDSAAFSAMWQAIKERDESTGPNSLLCHLNVTIPSGKYRIAQPINWTGLVAWNIHIHAGGAVLIGDCADKAVIDACNTRGLHIHGLAIHGNPASPPSCGILMAPSGTATCGNNCMTGLKTTGHFTVAAFANLGSETTAYYHCYFSNSYPSGFAYVADGKNILGASSDFVALRASGTAVSFTQNSFYSCHFRKYGGGDGVFLEYTSGWSFDQGCYHLAFSGANFRVMQSTDSRNSNLSIAGLFETQQAPGLEYCIRFVMPDGDFSAINGFNFLGGDPHAKESVFRLEGSGGADLTAGNLHLRSATIKLGRLPADATMFSGPRLTLVGDLHCIDGTKLNLSELFSFQGVVFTADSRLANMPTTGSHSFLLVDPISLSGQVARFVGANGQIGFQSTGVPVVRVDGIAADYDLRLQGKGNGRVSFGAHVGAADAAITGYIEIKDAGGTVRKLAVIS